MDSAVYDSINGSIAKYTNLRNTLAANNPRGLQLDQIIASLDADLQSVADQAVQAALAALLAGSVATYLTNKTKLLNRVTESINNVANALTVAATVVTIAGDIATAALAL